MKDIQYGYVIRIHIYKKVETGEMINTDMIQQEIEQEKQLGRIDVRQN